MDAGDFERALAGDELAQCRQIIRSLALHLKVVTCIAPTFASVRELRQASEALADAALEYLEAPDGRPAGPV